MELKAKLIEGDMPAYAHEGDAGLDLRITEDVTLASLERKTVGLGVAVAIPEGHAGLMLPRSGLASKRGITLANAPGLIDSGYRGELCAALVNISDQAVALEKGERVCQLLIVPFAACLLAAVEELDDTERGADGFGSTGTH